MEKSPSNILDMGNLWGRAFWGAHYGNDIQADCEVDAFGLDVVVDGLAKILEFFVVNGLFGLDEHTIATRLDFHKHHDIILFGDDVEILVTQLPIALNDVIAFM